MNWFGPGKKIEFVEQDDGLLIKVRGIKRVVDLLIPLAILAIAACKTWREHSWLASFWALGALGATLWIWRRNEDGELSITDRGILASGDLGGWAKDSVWFRWADISGLDFREGGEDQASGLYARTGRWNAVCITAGLSREQSEEVIAAVFKRFPYVVMAEDKDGWSLFGTASELTTLGLSDPKK